MIGLGSDKNGEFWALGFFHGALKKAKHFESELIELFTKNCYELPWKKWKEGTNALKAKFISVTFSIFCLSNCLSEFPWISQSISLTY